MVKFYFTSLFILFFSFGFSQSYTYLNASTGNENEFPVDKDTNIYMFHGNRLVKTDKNFNVIWANNYSFNFTSLLLSKTGTIYFLSFDSLCFGKLNSNGSVIWVRSTTINAISSLTTSVNYNVAPQRLILDRNNNLVLSGFQGATNSMGFILKTDTNGNAIQFKAFGQPGQSNLNKFSIMTDSAGVLKFLGDGTNGLGRVAVLFRYNDNVSTMQQPLHVYTSQVSTGFGFKYIKSKFSNFYIQVSCKSIIANTASAIVRLDMNGGVSSNWNREFSCLDGSLNAFSEYIEEDADGKLLYSIDNITGPNTYTSAVFCLDSNATIVSPSPMKMANGVALSPSPPTLRARVIYKGKYYFDITGGYFPSSPLTVQKFTSSFTTSCSSAVTFSVQAPYYGPISINSIVTIPITSYTVNALTSVVTPTTFAVDTNYCIVTGINGSFKNESEISIYPNPTDNILHIGNANYSVSEVEIFDVDGKTIRRIKDVSSISIGDLNTGIYFIRIKTDKGEMNKKFIKN